MSILDKTKGYAEKAMDAAAKATAAGKDKIDDARAQKKLHDLYAEIGRLVVAHRRGGPDPEVDVAARVAQISAIEHDHASGASAGDDDASEASA
ncbi:MAG: hypothetical protein ACRDV7_04505 [Acidimicrobiia bacterium]|jgi:hypothetical protein